MSKEEVKKYENEETEIDEETNEECGTYDDIANEMALQEEYKRISKQDKPTSKTSKEVKESELYKDVIAKAHIIGESMQILLGYGVDYSNAMTISNNMLQNIFDIEKVKVQSLINQNQQV